MNSNRSKGQDIAVAAVYDFFSCTGRSAFIPLHDLADDLPLVARRECEDVGVDLFSAAFRCCVAADHVDPTTAHERSTFGVRVPFRELRAPTPGIGLRINRRMGPPIVWSVALQNETSLRSASTMRRR